MASLSGKRSLNLFSKILHNFLHICIVKRAVTAVICAFKFLLSTMVEMQFIIHVSAHNDELLNYLTAIALLILCILRVGHCSMNAKSLVLALSLTFRSMLSFLSCV